MLDPDLDRLLVYEISSFAHWDILRCFLAESQEAATLDELALATGRDVESLLAVVGALVSKGWLARRVDPRSGQTAYWLTQEQSRQQTLERLQIALQEREAMLVAMQHWTQAPFAGP